MLGLFSKPLALLPAGSMLVNYWTADREAFTAFFADQETLYAANTFPFSIASVLVLVHGSGCSAADTPVAKPSSMRADMTQSFTEGSENAMIAAILSGNTQLFHELIRPHERTVYLMALSYLKNEADAEDAAQEAFISAYKNLATFRGEAKFSTWLISITLNEARNRLRRKVVNREESLEAAADESAPAKPALLRDWREIPSEAVERSEVQLLLQQAVIQLPEIYRQVFVLREVEEMNVKETAEALNISIPSVKVRLHRARMMLQKELAPALRSIAPVRRKRWFPW